MRSLILSMLHCENGFNEWYPATTERDDVNAIWDAMRTELQSDVLNIHQSNKAICVAGKSYLNFGNTLVLAAACCLVAFSSIFMVAAKQQATVLCFHPRQI